MSTVYFDPGALLSPRGAEASDAVVDAEAARMVQHLEDFGHEVVILWRDAPPQVAAASQTGPGADLPDSAGALEAVDGTASGWFVSDKPERCIAAHELRRLTTVLVGAADTARDLAHRPADRLARSLSDAVLDVEHAHARRDPSQIGERAGEKPGPPSHEGVVGGGGDLE
jgi:hypothetical protein